MGTWRPEALAGGPIGKVQDGDRIRIEVDRNKLTGSVQWIGSAEKQYDEAEAAKVLSERPMDSRLKPDANLPDDTRLWAALQRVGGGTWGGCVYDVDEILRVIEAGEATLRQNRD